MGWDWGDWSRRYSAGEHVSLPVDNQPYRALGLAAGGPQHALLAAGLWNGKVDQLTRETLLTLVDNRALSDSAVFTLINETKSRLDIASAFERARGGTYPVNWAAIGATVDAHVRRRLGTHPDTLLDHLTRGATTGLWLGVWTRDAVPLLSSHQAFLKATFSSGANRLHVLVSAEFQANNRSFLAELNLGERFIVDSSPGLSPPGVMLIIRSGHGADGAVYVLKHGPPRWTEQLIGGPDDAQNLFSQFESSRPALPRPAHQAVVA